MSEKTLVIDGNSILNRAFYGVKPLTTSDGRPTNAIFGFVNIILKQLESISPDNGAIAFDLRAKTFRHNFYDGYKAKRKGMPEELASQLDYAKEVSKYLGFEVLTLEGYEADDILGTVAKNSNGKCFILTGDRDSFQLVNENTTVLYASNKDTIAYDTDKINEVYGLEPKKLIEVKALMGDASDNIPGVAGIGEKTAIKLISDYGSVENLYKNLDSAPITKSVKEKLQNGKESAEMSRFLAEINCECPLDLKNGLKYKGFDRENLRKLFVDLELKSFITRLGLDKAQKTEDFGLFSDEIAPKERFSDYTECEKCPAFSTEVYVIPDFENNLLYCSDGTLYICPMNEENLKKLFSGKSGIVLFDSKEMYLHLKKSGIEFEKCSFDIMLAYYVAHALPKPECDNMLTGKDLSKFDLSDQKQKMLAYLYYMPYAKEDLTKKLEENSQNDLYYNIELPLAYVLADMEYEGFTVDVKGLSDYCEKISLRLEERKSNIYSLAGREFNINSTKQLSEVLYEELALPSFKKTKSGYSTDAETLEKLRPYHPIINEILEYRVVAKILSTYGEGLLKLADENGKLHTSFKQALTQTGRLSSTEPNLQNIPIRQEEGRELRKFFVPKSKDNVLIDADYYQIELRVLAAMSGDEAMINAFNEGIDIHTLTASQVFSVPMDEVTSDMRKKAKAVNFGIVYGISDFSLAGDIHITKKEAGEYIKQYFLKYPKIKDYLENIKQTAKDNGYVSTLFSRRRYIPELSSAKKTLVMFGERVAMNTPIQGTAADIIKIAMINVYNALKNCVPEAKLILQVHDELIVDVPREKCDIAKKILLYEMANAVNLAVPMEVSCSSGKSWFEAHA